LRNPWLTENPFMGMWLRAANSAAGSIRGIATAQAKRELTRATTKSTRDLLDIWGPALKPAVAPKKRARRG
jgi:hypothetical protein